MDMVIMMDMVTVDMELMDSRYAHDTDTPQIVLLVRAKKSATAPAT